MQSELETQPRARVLVAEDDADIRMVIAAGLRCDGHEVLEASDGIALFGMVRRAMDSGQPPDAIILDIRMPGLSGLRALAWLRAAQCRVAVVLVTGHADEAARETARRLEVEALLAKPFDLFELRGLVANILRRRSAHSDH